MSESTLLAPLCAYTFLLFGLWSLLGYVRVSRGLRGEIPFEYLRTGTGALPGDWILAVHHHFANQFEVPLLFYLACLALLVTHTVDGLAVGLAWAFVALRVIHTAIALIWNHPLARVGPYVLSTFAVWGLWLLLFRRAVLGSAG